MALSETLGSIFDDEKGQSPSDWQPVRESAALLDVTVRTIRNWRKAGFDEGFKMVNGRLLCNVPAVRDWAKKTNRGGRKRANKKGKDGEKSRGQITKEHTLTAVRIRKERALAEKYEIQVGKEKKQLISLDEVKRERLQRIKEVRAGLFSLPARLSGVCAGRSETEIQDEIESAINDLLERFAADG